MDFEKPASARDTNRDITVHHIDEKPLKTQEEYFEYCHRILLYLNGEALKRNNKQSDNEYVMPTRLPKPLPYTPPKTAPHFR